MHLTTLVEKLLEPQHDKTSRMTCSPSEDSDQPEHPPSLIRVFTVHSMGSQGHKVSTRTAKTDQIGQMPRLI